MTSRELRNIVSKSDFLFNWQRERLLNMIDEDVDESRYQTGTATENVIDHVLWRVFGVGVDSLTSVETCIAREAVKELGLHW